MPRVVDEDLAAMKGLIGREHGAAEERARRARFGDLTRALCRRDEGIAGTLDNRLDNGRASALSARTGASALSARTSSTAAALSA
jgi:hypothetical protein